MSNDRKMQQLYVEQTFFDNGKIESQKFLHANITTRCLHNECGPAFQEWYENGTLKSEMFYVNGKRNDRNGAPAVTHWYDDGSYMEQEFCQNGHLHREDGPAYIIYNGRGGDEERYYLNDQQLSKEEFEKRKKKLTEPTCDGKIVTIDGKEYYLTLKDSQS